MELSEIAEELENYAEAEGSEAGEYWLWLCEGARKTSAMSLALETVFAEELKATLQYCKESFVKVRRTETRVVTYVEIVDVDELEDDDEIVK